MVKPLVLFSLLLLPYSSHAQDGAAGWPQFLGPRGNAAVEKGGAALSFDLERDLSWRVALPPGSSSPCIHGDRIFLTGSEGEKLLMIALERKTGEQLWQRERPAPPAAPKAHVDADPAAPTPCTDGERVVFYFGGYGLVATDLEGELLWEKPLPVPEAAFGIGTSPILVDDMVVLSRDGCPDSGIHAFAKTDGAERWSRPRVGFTYSFGTPFH
jgi:outer membrane protein assembly factor BamB